MLPIATVEHVMPGRLRVRIPDLRNDASYFRSAVEKLSKHPEVSALRANPATGSIVILHEADLPAIRDIAAKSEVFDLREAPTPRPSLLSRQNGQTAESRKTAMNGRAPTLAGGEAASLGLTGLGALQAMRGHAVGPATENFWNAFGALRILNNPLVALMFGGLGVLQLMRGRMAGSASSLLFYAFVIRQMSGSGPRRESPYRPDGPERR